MSENKLIYPTLELFLYDLRESLGETPTKIDDNRKNFWHKIDPKISEEELKKYAKAEKPEANYAFLIDSNNKVIKFNSDIDGYYFPVQLGDTYALRVDCSGKYLDSSQEKPNFDPQPVKESVAELKKIIVSHNQETTTNTQPQIKSTLGQTWLLWGQLAAGDQDTEETAKECYESLAGSDWNNDIQSQGKFLDAEVFELWRYPTDWTAKWGIFNQESQHVIILLFPANQNIEEIRDKIAKVYFDFMRLLCYRHKVNFAYYQGCRLRPELKGKYAKIRKFREEISPQLKDQKLSLKQLRKDITQALTDLSEYTERLNKLESQIRTIDRNFKNYQLRQENFTNPDDKKISLKFILDASESDFTPAKYKEQLETDLSNLSPALKLLENLIRNIEGIIEIEQTKSEQTLSYTVGFVGAGLAASGITATILSTQILTPEPTKTPTPESNSKISTPQSSLKIPTPNPNSKEAMSVEAVFGWSIISIFFSIALVSLILFLSRFVRR